MLIGLDPPTHGVGGATGRLRNRSGVPHAGRTARPACFEFNAVFAGACDTLPGLDALDGPVVED